VADEGDVNLRNALQYLVGPDAVERGEPREKGNGSGNGHGVTLARPPPPVNPAGSLDHVDVRIGVTQAPREINLELAEDADRDDLKSRIEASRAGATDTLWITDKRGNDVAIPSAKIAYVELGSAESARKIGFGD
jgi:hypothetical protein